MASLLFLVVIAIASFGPPQLRGFAILFCAVTAMIFTALYYSPRADTPTLPEEADPDVASAESLIEKHAVKQSRKNQKIQK